MTHVTASSSTTRRPAPSFFERIRLGLQRFDGATHHVGDLGQNVSDGIRFL
jgi:hypothetical protein